MHAPRPHLYSTCGQLFYVPTLHLHLITSQILMITFLMAVCQGSISVFF